MQECMRVEKQEKQEGTEMAEIGMIGAGSWGTALAVVLEKNGHATTR